MPRAKYQIGAVVYDEDLRIFRKATAYDIGEQVRWAVYENGQLGDVYNTSDEAKAVVKDLREFP